MKNMSKTNKERLMKMNLQTFAAEDGLTVANDLGKSVPLILSIFLGIPLKSCYKYWVSLVE